MLPVLLAILVFLPNGTYQQLNPWINNYGIATYPLNYAVIYSHVLGSGTYTMYLPPGGYYSIEVSGPGPLGLYMWASSRVILQILNQTGYDELRSGGQYQPLFMFVGSSMNTTVYVPQGTYYVIVVNNGSIAINAVLAIMRHYPTALINAPIGIVDYGLAPTVNGYIPYSYITREFLGSAVINEAVITTITNCQSLPPGSFSLQLNAVLELSVNDRTQYYWLQNVMIIDPKNELLLPLVNVWNMSSESLIMNPLYIIGRGSVINNTAYAYMGNWTPYTTPLAINLTISVNNTPNGFPDLLFSYSMNGIKELVDNVTLLLRPDWGPYLVVNGSEYSPLGYLVDSEFIIGGPGCGATVFANEVNASLSLYYLGPSNRLFPVPTAWSFGSDTGETIVNVGEEVIGPAVVKLMAGNEYLGPLTNANYINFLVINNYLLNGTFISASIPVLTGSRVLLTTERIVNFGNNTLVRLTGIWVNGMPVNNSSLELLMNGSYVVSYNWARYYWLQVIDESNQVTNMSGWYLANSIVNITVPKTAIYFNNDTRLVFARFLTNATHYVVSGNSIVLLINLPIQLAVDWVREYNVSLTLYTINNTPIITEHLGWLPMGSEVTNVTIGGINYPLEVPLSITGPELTAIVDAKYAQFVVRDSLNLPEPLAHILIKCDGQEIATSTNILGVTPRLLIPTSSACTIMAQPIGYYSLALIVVVAVLIIVILKKSNFQALNHSKAM